MRLANAPVRVVVAVAGLALGLFGSPSVIVSARPAGGAAARAEGLGLTCSTTTTPDGVTYQKCTGEIPSFDGIGLDTDLSLPASGSAPFPTIVMMHGWSGDKTDWESDTKSSDSPDKDRWNNVWFVSQGWAVVNYTARGFKESCGQLDADPNCITGWTHLADRDFETRDSQTLLGTLVDEGIADPARMAATGGSYGGGQSWLLATSLPWTSPAGRAELQLAAAVPKYPWTDLLYALAPNGRQTDSTNQSRSHERPLGVPKEDYIDALYAAGRAVGEGRYNTTDPSDYGSALDEDYAFVQAGEPYDSNPAATKIAAAFRNKSSYYARDYLNALRSGSVTPVPVLSIQGWTDPLFPGPETLQMYRRLKAVDPSYPISIAFGDIGHSNAADPGAQWSYLNQLGNDFLAAFVLGDTGRKPRAEAYSFHTACSYGDSEQPVTGSWDGLAQGTLALAGEGSQATTSAASNILDGQATDPLTHTGCMTEPSTPPDPGRALWTWDVGSAGFTLLGLPRLAVRYDLQGKDATVALKLWDVAPDGTMTLVSRGAYRIAAYDGDPTSGTLRVELFGNQWHFAPGDQVELQISQADAPYLRPDNLASTITWSSPRLVLPTLEP